MTRFRRRKTARSAKLLYLTGIDCYNNATYFFQVKYLEWLTIAVPARDADNGFLANFS